MSDGWIAFWSTVGGVVFAVCVAEIVRRAHGPRERREESARESRAQQRERNAEARAAVTAYVVSLSTANDWLRKHIGSIDADDVVTATTLRQEVYSRWDNTKILPWHDHSSLLVLDAAAQRAESVFAVVVDQKSVPDDFSLGPVRDDVRGLLAGLQ